MRTVHRMVDVWGWFFCAVMILAGAGQAGAAPNIALSGTGKTGHAAADIRSMLNKVLK